ncbi:hypothetical protein NCAS_0I00830 [Naumovozyma castellii]|uniref:ATP synthase subunit delta, mitochondrial n=1 Tax=Naumovozyma castellii TaxID=27288 RepID=G0VJS0_NAUCA|nr:hypothetical protein NCAS_0I00830 [Naumovozyma castellii CBS 4309]CCC71751.1 hypothetical protein NCAS_0I00830 [Naumovozyma castellii CBS 4309]
MSLNRSIQSVRSLQAPLRLIARRTYAEHAASTIGNALRLQFALPHETLYEGAEVKQVNLPAKSGRIGILANHIPTVEQLEPGIVEIFTNANNNEVKKFFISGGFATMQPDSTLCVTAVEAFPLDSFSQENVKNLLTEAKKDLNNTDSTIAAEAQIKINLLESLEAALK